jgi:phytanoyl-CoA hydroxylase
LSESSVATSDIRDSPLSGDELFRFYADGFLRLGRVLDDQRIEALRTVIADRRQQRLDEVDLLDPAIWPEAEGGVPQEPGRNVSFLFNLWREEPEFRQLVTDRRFAGWAAQVLGATAVRVLEDNALTKDAGSGGELRWHQDYAYWPLGQPNAVTIWIALDEVTAANGAVRMAPGSHLLGERLPAVFGTGASYFAERRPMAVRPITDPADAGLDVEVLELGAGEATIHHALTWHASGANSTDRPRRAAVVRYVADGTIWFGADRYEFNYTDEEVGLRVGDPIGGPYFPLVSAGHQ